MKRLLLLLALTTAAACASTPSTPQSPVARDIDAFVNQVLREVPAVPSIAIAVVKDGNVVYLREPSTPYYIGSATKAYTGLACAILAQRGQLDLDAPITKYLPEVTLANAPTLRALLTHSSGISNEPVVFRTAYSGEHAPRQLVSLLNSSKPTKAEFRYDNLGYVVASLILERITGKPWQTVLEELVFAPLGMHHTTTYISKVAGALPATYSQNRKGELAPATLAKNDRTMHAAGGIVTTASDLARWLEANITNGRIDSKQAIPAAAFEEIHRMQVRLDRQRGEFKTRGYGFGWYQSDYDGDDVLLHGGDYPGWHTLYSFMPQRGAAVGVMTNTSGFGGAAAESLAVGIYDLLLQKPNAQQLLAQRIEKLKERVDRGTKAFLADVEKRAKRPWTLTQPKAAYAGRFENPLYGTIAIEQRDDTLHASLAQLRSVLEPFTEPDTARVELVPDSGEIFFFHVAADGSVDSLRWRDEVFRRAN